jgi:hypothetical protein
MGELDRKVSYLYWEEKIIKILSTRLNTFRDIILMFIHIQMLFPAMGH